MLAETKVQTMVLSAVLSLKHKPSETPAAKGAELPACLPLPRLLAVSATATMVPCFLLKMMRCKPLFIWFIPL